MDSHLIAVEIGVKRRADHRMDPDGFSLDEDRLERLDTEPVEGGRTVEEHRMSVDNVFENFPDLLALLIDHLLGALDCLHEAALNKFPDNERLEQLDRHIFRESALMQLQFRPDDDDGPARVIDAFAEKVLAEASLLSLEHIRERLQRTVIIRADRVDAARVVEQGIDCFLEHALFVPENNFRGLDLDQAFQAVIADDDTPVEIVQIRCREPPPFQGHERTKFRGDDRDNVEDHPLGLVHHAVLPLAE